MENPSLPVVDMTAPKPDTRRKLSWIKLSIWANIVLVVCGMAVLAGSMVIYQSDTNPLFCRTCHNMERHVDSYLTSKNLDNVHFQANVQCKQCHDYPIPAEIESGIKYITNNYDQSMPRRKFSDDMCLECHISNHYVAIQTDFLPRNPHNNHFTDLKCSTCHVSHGEQIDYCSQCHDNGGQRMTGAPLTPRLTTPSLE